MSSVQHIETIGIKEELICEEVHITGDVANESIIDAHKLTIDGTTRKGSTQFAKHATLYSHQGILRCHEAKVTFLNEGEIHATSVNVDTARGGSIYAQDVYIKNLQGDVLIYASHSISIDHINGKDNKLFIDYKKVPIMMSKIELIEEDVQELTESLKNAKKENSSLEQEIEIEIERLKDESLAIQNSTKNAKISISSPLTTKNLISFQINDFNSISYETEKNTYTPFYLSYKGNVITLKPTSTTLTLNS